MNYNSLLSKSTSYCKTLKNARLLITSKANSFKMSKYLLFLKQPVPNFEVEKKIKISLQRN